VIHDNFKVIATQARQKRDAIATKTRCKRDISAKKSSGSVSSAQTAGRS
jgi:hypothetical protein